MGPAVEGVATLSRRFWSSLPDRVVTALPAAILLVAYAALFAAVPITRDSGVFMYSGRTILAGSAPYAASWDHKGPALYLLDALGLLLGDGSPRGVICLEGLTLAASLLVAVRCWASLGSSYLAAGVGTAYVISFLSLFEGGNLTETWLSAFSLVALSLVARTLLLPATRRELLISGVAVGTALGVALMTRPNNAVGLGVAALVLVVTCKAHRAALALAIGCTLGIVVASSLFLVAARGSLGLMWAEYIQYNRGYARAPFLESALSLAQLSMLVVLTPLFIVALTATVGWLRRASTVPSRARLALGTLAAVVAVDLLSQGMSGRGFTHYAVVVLPGLAVFTLTALHAGGEERLLGSSAVSSRLATRAHGVLATVAVLVTTSLAGVSMAQLLRTGLYASGSELGTVTRTITSLTSPTDEVLVHGAETRFLVTSDRRSPTDRTYIGLFLDDAAAVRDYGRDVRRERPALIVRAPYMPSFSKPLCPDRGCAESRRALDRFDRWVLTHYRPSGQRDGYEFWRRRSS